MKKKPIPIDKFIAIVKEEYIYLKVIPHKSIRNYNSSNVARSIALSYKSLTKLIKIENKKLFIKNNFKVSYLIEIKSGEVNFYFIIPKVFKNIMLEKLSEIWSKATIEEVEPIEPISSHSLNYQVYYEKEDALSIDTNKKTNEPLNTLLNVVDIMQDNDRILVGYNLNPTSQTGWSLKYDEIIKNFKDGKPIDKDKSSKSYILRYIGSTMISIIETIFETINDFIPSSNDIQKHSLMNTLRIAFEEKKDLSIETKKKRDTIILDGEILVSSQSKDETRKYNNLKSVADAYQVLDGDNKLISKELKTTPVLEKKNWGCIMNKFSADECQNFIQIAGYELLKRFKINHVNTEEVMVPDFLQEGTKYLGTSTYKGTKTNAYLDDEWNAGNLPLLLLASQGSGKSTYMTNYANYCAKVNESVIVVDFIKNCELSSSIEKVVDKNKLVILDLSKESDLQSFCFNEIVIPKNMSPFDKLKLASLASQQTISLVDSINEGDPLSSRMRRYLNASCMICYVLGHNTLRDVINCLENPKVRERYMNELGVLSIHLGDEIDTLHSLNEYTKPTKKEPEPQLIGNKDSKIEYILDRICLLSEDFKLKYMFNKSPNNNINFVDIMNQGKILLIKMKESEYPTKQHKNILTTFFMSKIWLACQLRGSIQDKPLRTNIICDELFQAPTALNMLTYVLPQSRKFGCKLILSSQYLTQLKGLHTVLEACGASVMLMKGVSELDWKFYSSKIEGFEYDDLVNMPAYHSINLIYTHTGKFYNFLTQLPKPV